MEVFKTQFTMSGVATDVTVQLLPDNAFACTLNLADFFEGGELEGNNNPPDVTLKRSQSGKWQTIGESKVHLSELDLENLGKAIISSR